MLATLVIGLREGLEAALIVGIIAAFLRNNGKSLIPMWLGVALAVALSIAVGVSLALLEQALPQAAQEGLETVIGAIAVVFVTGMIVWMHRHAHQMKRQLETEAAQALGKTGAYALASMAFLAVLKEGFETCVFLLATLSVAQSSAWATVGAVTGLLAAAFIGWGIFVGSVRFNLSRFFRITTAFLILVAAGLVVACLRTAHEAGWLNAGQQVVLNLDWLVAPGTIQSALITGVLGIPADPRLVEVLAWLAYLIPVSLYLYWPAAKRPGPRSAMRLRLAVIIGLAVSALALTVLWPQPQLHLTAQQPLTTQAEQSGNIGHSRYIPSNSQQPAHVLLALDATQPIRLALASQQRQTQQRNGLVANVWNIKQQRPIPSAPSTLTIEEVVAMTGGRIPIGLNPRQHPGPYHATWTSHSRAKVWRSHHALLDATGRRMVTVTLSGGGLQTPRTLVIRSSQPAGFIGHWQISPDAVAHTAGAVHHMLMQQTERRFWALQLPVFMLLLAALMAWFGWRHRRAVAVQRPTASPHSGYHSADTRVKKGGELHAAH